MEQKTRSALLIEDNPFFTRMMSDYLGELGFARIVEASSTAEAIEKLKQEKPDLVCMDLVLPDGSGYDLCEYIRGQEEYAGLRILMISARSLMIDRAQAEEAGADGYLTKPYTREQFVEHVQRVLALPSRGG
jgi:two-component system chemotaxis response regulator CheY